MTNQTTVQPELNATQAIKPALLRRDTSRVIDNISAARACRMPTNRRSPKWSPDLRHMHISIFGMGNVGAVSMACLADIGHHVIGVDPDPVKVKMLNAGCSPILESGLDKLVEWGRSEQRFQATHDECRAVLNSEATMVCVGTPCDENGECDLSQLCEVSAQIGRELRKKHTYHLVIYRNTVPPGTTRDRLIPILEKHSGKVCGKGFGVCFIPEFLRETTAVRDFFNPGKTVIGAFDEASADIANCIYRDIGGMPIVTSLESAEFTKYVDNTWHALKVTFANEVGRLCKAMDIDSHDVMDIFLRDTKLNISRCYLKPGFAFGGSCLPKDTRGINHLARSMGVRLPVISNINNSNQSHLDHTLRLIEKAGVQRVGIVGVSFKVGAEDVRESPALELLHILVEKGYEISFYDPYVSADAELHPDPSRDAALKATRCLEPLQLLERAELLVVTHDDDYSANMVALAQADTPVIDLVHSEEIKKASGNYEGLCW